MADAEAESEPTPPINPLSVLSQQVARKGNFKMEQKANDRLKHCWGQVKEVDGVRNT